MRDDPEFDGWNRTEADEAILRAAAAQAKERDSGVDLNSDDMETFDPETGNCLPSEFVFKDQNSYDRSSDSADGTPTLGYLERTQREFLEKYLRGEITREAYQTVWMEIEAQIKATKRKIRESDHNGNPRD